MPAPEAGVEKGTVLGIGLGLLGPVPDPPAGTVVAGCAGGRSFAIRTPAGDAEEKKRLEGSEPVEEEEEEGEEEEEKEG